MNKIRLLNIMNSLDIGGAEKSAINLLNKLAIHFEYISIFSGDGAYYRTNKVNNTIEVFPSFSNKPYKIIINLYRIFYIIFKKNINLIFYHHRKFSIYIHFIRSFFPHIKIVHIAHSIFFDFTNKFLKADLYIAVSSAVKENLESYGKNNVHIINNGIEISSIPRTPQLAEVKTIGFVGRFVKTKGITTLLGAFSEIQAKYPKINLLFRGTGPEKDRIYEFIKKHELENRISIEGPVIELENIYKNIDILVLPSTSDEGFGLVLIEAMSLGIPVIASDYGGITDIVKHNQNGLLYKLEEQSELANQIELLIQDFELRNELINNALTDIKTKFNCEIMVNKYLTLLNSFYIK